MGKNMKLFFLKLVKTAAVALGVPGALCILISTKGGDASFLFIPGLIMTVYALYLLVIHLLIQRVKQQKNIIQSVIYYLLIILSLMTIVGPVFAPDFFVAEVFNFIVEGIMS